MNVFTSFIINEEISTTKTETRSGYKNITYCNSFVQTVIGTTDKLFGSFIDIPNKICLIQIT
jgi:hypothetical protein